VFGTAAGGEDRGVVEGFELRRELRGDDAGAFNLNGVDGGVLRRLIETADNGVDFGEFGHECGLKLLFLQFGLF